MVQHFETSKEQIAEETHLTKAVASTAMKFLKAGKAPGEDDIQPEMLKAMNNFGIPWLTHVCQVAWKISEMPKPRRTSVLIPIKKKKETRRNPLTTGAFLY